MFVASLGAYGSYGKLHLPRVTTDWLNDMFSGR